MKKLSAIILAICSAAAFAAGFDTSSAISEMKSTGKKIKMGKTEATGIYIMCMETVQIQNGDLALAQETAKLQARTAIAEFMNVQVSSHTKRTTVTKETVNNDEENFSQMEFMQKCMKKNVNQVQRGVAICSMEKRGERLTVFCLLMEKVVDATAQLEKAMKKLGPDTVQVSGTAFFGNGITQAAAEKAAMAEAQREAIAQVLGMSVVSSSARQTISSESVDNDGKENFSCDDSFKAKVFSSAAGFVESSRVVDKKVDGATVTVTIVAKVSRNKLMSDYRSYLESMGNPGFCVRSNNRDMLELCSGFFAGLGLRMVDNLYDSAYVIDVICDFNESEAAVRVVVKDKVSGNTLFSQENTPVSVNGRSQTALCRSILNQMKGELHQKLNTFIGRANADGRAVQVKILNYESDYRASIKAIEKALKMVPGVSNVRKKTQGSTILFTMNYKSETEDLADFLEKQIKVDIKRRSMRPVRGDVSNTSVEFCFE
ncbi:MAG: hypothetical protein IKD29_01250 [Lentisphaeria bacterium]|nr:hypothetical protein [Lentisphaeria bacterium]